MNKLWLKFSDEKGNSKRVEVCEDEFLIGRSPENHLQIHQQSISRKHLKIQRFGQIFVAYDLGSSNGTTVNGEKLSAPVALKNGDKINCGGGFTVEIEIENKIEENQNDRQKETSEDPGKATEAKEKTILQKSSTPFASLFLAPILGLLFFTVAILFLFLSSPEKTKQNSSRREKQYEESSRKNEKNSNKEVDFFSTHTATNSPNIESLNKQASTEEEITTNEQEKIERNALLFVKRISLTEANYVFTRKQIEEIEKQLKNVLNSPLITSQLKDVKRNESKITEMARSKGLKPAFLAAASIATNSKSTNILKTAQDILPVLNNLKISLGNELPDDNLLIIAAFEQGTKGDFRSMRNMIEAIGKESGVEAHKVRTVWYLRETNKISNQQYELVLRFLAIGTIMQNPKDFGIREESTTF